jgi:hypothetical protein
MKRLLLASTAMIAFGAVAAHADSPLSLSIGGFWVDELGYSSNKQYPSSSQMTAGNQAAAKYARFTNQDYGQLNFVGSTKLDNGVTVGLEVDAVIDQYNDSRGDCGAYNYQNGGSSGKVSVRPNSSCNSFVKRSFGTLSGQFGTLMGGEREDISYIVHNTAPDVAWGLSDADWPDFANTPINHAFVGQTSDARWTTRTTKITYVTPALFGVSAGVTYTPTIQASNGDQALGAFSSTDHANYANIGYDGRYGGSINRSDFQGDAFSEAIALNNTFGPVSVKADVGATELNYESEQLIDGGLQVGAYGFTLGGSYLYRGIPSNTSALSTNDPNTAAACNPLCYVSHSVARAAAFTGHSEDVALAYAIGPYAVSFGYFGDRTANSQHASDTTSAYALSGAYTFGPGVAFKLQLYHFNMGSGDTTAAKASETNKGNGAIAGWKVQF